MIRFLLFLSVFAMVSTMNAQTFTDDFESYADGDKIGASSSSWTTWSGGLSDDAPITTEQAHSGTKSLKFHGVTDGGPSDVILPFPSKLTSGTFNLELYIYVKGGNKAYFNLQGETAPGVKWAEDFYFNSAGSFTGSKFPFIGGYSQGQWVKFNLNVDISHNIWSIYLDDVYTGSYINPVNTIASMDIFPTDGFSDFYIDDVSYTYSPMEPILPNLNATLNSISRRSLYLVGYAPTLGATVRNTSMTPITSFNVTYSDGTGISAKAITGVDIASLEEYQVDLTDLANVIEPGTNNFSVAISGINGGNDSTDVDNHLFAAASGITPAVNKKVLFEEGTGTWCKWCPRGAVFMERMTARYPDHFVGIAVHSGAQDPMVVSGYPSGVGFSSYPSMVNDRTNIFDFGTMSDVDLKFFLRVIKDTPASIFSAASYDANTKLLSITTQADFQTDAAEQYKLAVVLTEDGVTGTGSQYGQQNAYAGGANGPMGGYENLPSVVPASQMVYDHVGRALISPFGGAPSSIPLNAVAGESYNYKMPDYTLGDFDFDQLHIITLLIDANGKVSNVNSQTMQEAMDFVLADNLVETTQDFMEVYPNPFNGQSSIFLSLQSPSNVEMTIVNSIGQIMLKKRYGMVSEKSNLDFDASQLDKGVYFIRLNLDSKVITQRIVIQ